MSTDKNQKLIGLNGWFLIEIISFYGYILSAGVFILERSIKSSLGRIKKDWPSEQFLYQFDFIVYHRKDLNWFAFLTILFLENSCLIFIDRNIIYADPEVRKKA